MIGLGPKKGRGRKRCGGGEATWGSKGPKLQMWLLVAAAS